MSETIAKTEAQTLDTFEELVEFVTESHNQSSEQIVLCLAEMANALRSHANQATDLVPPEGKEEEKRNAIKLWRAQADHLDKCAKDIWSDKGLVEASHESR